MTSILRLAWRQQRVGFRSMAIGGALYAAIQAGTFTVAAGSTPPARAAFGVQIQSLGRQVSYLLPIPQRADTIGGYVHWRGVGVLALAFGVWAAASASGAMRKDDDRRRLEMILASAVGRVAYVTARGGAFAAAAALVIVISAAACEAAGLATGAPLDAGGLAGDSAALLALTLSCYAIGLLLAQVPATARLASSATVVAVSLLFLCDSLTRNGGIPDAVHWVSPFWYWERTTSLIPGGSLDVVGLVALLAVAATGAKGAAIVFAHRDLGRGVLRQRSARPPLINPEPLMRLPVVRDLWLQRVALLWWCIGFAVLAGFMTSVAAPAADALRKLPVARSLISTFGRTNLTVAFIGTYSLGIAALLTAIYAVTQVGRWAADDAEGRLALVLSTPTSRARVVIERGFVLLVSCVPLAVVTGAVTLMVASRGGISLDLATLWAASFLLLPFALTFGAVGAALTSWRPRMAMGILIALAAISYLLQTYAPLVRWPAWTLQLSVFHLYGTPFVDRDNVGGLLLLVGVSLAGFVVAIAAARRADVAG